MNKLLVISILVTTILLSGCASRGRLSLIDIDLRSQSQIEAYEKEALIVYQDAPTINAATKSFDFSIISTILSAVKGRIKVLSIEWKNN